MNNPREYGVSSGPEISTCNLSIRSLCIRKNIVEEGLQGKEHPPWEYELGLHISAISIARRLFRVLVVAIFSLNKNNKSKIVKPTGK